MPLVGRSGARPRRRPVVRSAAALGALFAGACHVYVPIEEPAPADGSSVRVLIAPDASQRLAQQAGRPMPQDLKGRYEGSAGDSIRVSVLIEQDPRYPQQRLRQEFSVSRSEVIQVQTEVFSRRRTTLLGVGVVGLVAVLISQYSSSGGDQGPSDGPPDVSPAIRVGIPIFR